MPEDKEGTAFQATASPSSSEEKGAPLALEMMEQRMSNEIAKFGLNKELSDFERRLYVSYYKLKRPTEQLTSLVEDALRAAVANIKIDDLFSHKDTVATAVADQVNLQLHSFGYHILQVLITDIDPDPRVKEAMNRINAAQRLQSAVQAEAEAEKIKRVKQAEAEAAAMHLHGVGIANARREIVKGLQESVTSFAGNIHVPPEQVLQVVLTTQYYDALKEMAASSKTNTLFVPHGNSDIVSVREGLQALQMSKK